MAHATESNSVSSFDKGDLEKTAVVPAPIAEFGEAIDPVAEKALVRKLDRRMLPLFIVMYLFSALDRSNIGAAKTDGFTDDLHFGLNDYSLILTLFYIPFCTLTVPGNALTKRIGPHLTLPTMMFCWGLLCLCNAFAKNSGQVMGIRLLIGAFEASFAPGVIYTLTNYYRRDELGVRVAWFYVASPVSGAVSGLISYGVFSINGSLHGWQILFILEGGLTMVVALIAYFIIPKSIEDASFLTRAEKDICRQRHYTDSSNENEEDDKFSVTKYFEPLKDRMLYVYGLIALSYGVPVASVGNWLPQVVGRLGYDKLRTNALTVPPYAAGAVVLFFLAWNSDRTHQRAWHLMAAMSSTFLGFVLLAALDPTKHIGVSLFAVFLLCFGAFVPSVIFHTWHNNNDTSSNGRAFRTAFLTFCANSGGLVSSNVFRGKDAPMYKPALIVNFAFLACGLVLVFLLRTYMMRENARRNKEQGVNWTFKDVPTHLIKDRDTPEFRYFP